ncbi:MAG TPA: BTAD domain-containing putative transcriptional regulator, partial [Actinomycetota bacterium]|nr:BTAD domain-containing putative transcriptional regulator [Actinomycetota bacterium]
MTIEIRVLGRFSVRRDGVEIPAGAFRGRLVRSLVRLLVTRRGSFVSRDLLIEALWPAGAPADPDLNLNVLVTRARNALGAPSLILTGPGGYSFAGTDACSVDAELFLELVAAGRMTDALARWGGEPLAEDAYADWAQEYRDRLNRSHLEALEGAAAAALAAGVPARAVAWARLAVAEAPLREASYLVLARALAASRDTAGALEVLAGLRGKLAEDLGLDPSTETLELEARILRGEEAGVPVATPPAASARQFGGLAFIGREAELGAILAMGEGAALVAGASGSGKSRLLAEAVARSGRPALSVRASPSERDEPWHIVRALVRAGLALDPQAADALAKLPAEALAEAVPELAALRPATGGPLDVESRRALVLEGAVRFVEAVAGADCLLAVDDLQWADASSLAVLERAAARLPAMELILAIRPEEVAPGGPAGLYLERLAALGRPLVRIDLGPLTERALGAAIADSELVTCVVEDTDGSPMAVAELVRELAARGALGPGPDGRWIAASADAHALAREAARRGQRTTIGARVDRHPLARRELLALLALLGRPVPARLLALSVGAPAGIVLGHLDALGRTELVNAGADGWSVAHDL